MKLFVFGYGFTGSALARRLGWPAAATARTPEQAAALEAQGVTPVDPTNRKAMAAALKDVGAVLVTAPPGDNGCPGLSALVPALAEANAYPDWIGYLSTTGVYGDREGRWVYETSPLMARSVEGARRVRAERDWTEVGRGMGLTVQVFRLPGIYGPGRSAFDRLAAGTAKRVVKPGQVFSRIHVDDIASGLAASIARPRAGGIYNLCDDEPAPPQDVIAYAARLMGVEEPPEAPFDPNSRFYAENKRVSNALAKAELGWRPAYPTYREGLTAIAQATGLLDR
jgi:nucleoside-diphosphate-sugar epimerase